MPGKLVPPYWRAPAPAEAVTIVTDDQSGSPGEPRFLAFGFDAASATGGAPARVFDGYGVKSTDLAEFLAHLGQELKSVDSWALFAGAGTFTPTIDYLASAPHAGAGFAPGGGGGASGDPGNPNPRGIIYGNVLTTRVAAAMPFFVALVNPYNAPLTITQLSVSAVGPIGLVAGVSVVTPPPAALGVTPTQPITAPPAGAPPLFCSLNLAAGWTLPSAETSAPMVLGFTAWGLYAGAGSINLQFSSTRLPGAVAAPLASDSAAVSVTST